MIRRDAYRPPTAPLVDPARPQPGEWQRVKWCFGGLALLLTLLGFAELLLTSRPSPSVTVLTLICVVVLGLAGLISCDIWNLTVRRFPLWVDVLIYAAVFSALGAYIYARETGIATWSSLYIDLPLVLLFATVTVVAAITEAKKSVRVYFTARTLLFFDE